MNVKSLAVRSPWPRFGSAALSASLAQAGLRCATSSPLVVERGWPLAKIPLMLRCADPDEQQTKRRWWTFYCLGSEQIPFACRSALKNRAAVYLDDLHAIVQRFPHDLLLSGVDQAVSKKTALPAVNSALQADGREWQSLTTRLLSYKPSRRLTVRYRVTPAEGRGRTIFGKLLPTLADQQVLQVQQALEKEIVGKSTDQFSVPQLAGRAPEWNALFWRRAPGRSVFELLRSTQLPEAIGRTARCLAGLHTSQIHWLRTHDRERELGTVRNWIRAAGAANPAEGVELDGVFQHLSRMISKGDAASLVPSHRDFYDKQIVIDDRRCALLDLEVACRAEPELDVANFLAHLELRSLQGRMERVAPTAHLFMEEYSGGGPRLDTTRLRWYLASTLLRLACVYSLRIEWAGLTSNLAQASIQALKGDPVMLGASV